MEHEEDRPLTRVSRPQRLAIRRLFANLSGGFDEKFLQMLELRHAFHQELGAAFEPLLVEQCRSQPHATQKDKRKVALAIGSCVEQMGLQLRHASSRDEVSIETDDVEGLKGLPSTNPSPNGRYVLVSGDVQHPRIVLTSDVLPELEVVPPRLSEYPLVFGWPRNAVPRGRIR
ncbi:MAG TPA: hypothetical protein VHN77_14645 [Phycisphaerales bacterium]|nr:hypothetical protein [Phycisphaerales bacterium]